MDLLVDLGETAGLSVMIEGGEESKDQLALVIQN